jgi:uncharacterized protein (DUF1697 family)
METLRGVYKELGFSNVRTYVQSGNVVFNCPEQDPTGLIKRIEAHIEKTFGYPVLVFIRHAHELQRILAGNPFLNNKNMDLNKLHVTFLYQSPPETAWTQLIAPSGILDEFAPGDLAIYLYCPNGYGKTRLSNNFFERKLGIPVTTRNWNTVNALYNMVMQFYAI